MFARLRRTNGATISTLAVICGLMLPASAHADADLRLAGSGPAAAAPASIVTYSVTVTNDGPDPAAGIVAMVSLSHVHGDPSRPYLRFVSGTGGCADAGSNFVQCSFGDLAATASASASVTVELTPQAPMGGHVTVTGSLPPDANTANDEFVASTYVTPQDLAFVAKPPSFDSDTTPRFAVDADASTALQCRLDAGAWSTCGADETLPALGAGTHVYRVRLAGATHVEASHAWTIDTVAPSITSVRVEGLANGYLQDPSASVRYDASDDHHVAGWTCRLDDRPIGCSSAGTELSGLSERRHVLRVQAVDGAGNRSGWRTLRFLVDTQAPRLDVTHRPSGTTSARDAEFWITTSNEPASLTYECSLDGARFSRCRIGRFVKLRFGGLAMGSHVLRVRATDGVGRRSATISESWRVVEAPTLASFHGPSGVTRQDSAYFRFEANERGVVYHCSLDGARYISCPGRLSAAHLDDGRHELRVVLTHLSSGNSRTYERVWTVRTALLPKLASSAGPMGVRYSTSSRFTFAANKRGVRFECSLDGSSFVDCASPYQVGGLSYGEHQLRLRLVDGVGRQKDYSWSWRVVRLPELASSAGPRSRINTRSTQFLFAANKSGVTFTCQRDGGAWHRCSSGYVWSGLAAGEHTLRLRLTDTLGNTRQYTWRFDVVTVRPTLHVSGPSGPTFSSDGTFRFSSDRSGMRWQCVLDDVVQSCSSPLTLRGVPTGTHSLVIVGWDADGNQTSTVRRTWEVVPAGQQPTFAKLPAVPITSLNAASIIATGGLNIIATGGLNIIATGGGNIIAAGGGNIIATGGGNIIATGGLNFRSGSGGSIIATGGGNIIATGGGNIIATGGLN